MSDFEETRSESPSPSPSSNAVPSPAPISQQAFDFRVERVELMDAATVENELANAMSGDPVHPYMNARDLRHNRATAYVQALFERQDALRPRVDKGAVLIEQMQASKREHAEQLRSKMSDLGFVNFELPTQVDDIHIHAMERDILIAEGRLDEAYEAMKQEVTRWSMDQAPSVLPILDALKEALSDWRTRGSQRYDDYLQDLTMSTQKVISKLVSARYRAVQANADEAMRRDRERGKLNGCY